MNVMPKTNAADAFNAYAATFIDDASCRQVLANHKAYSE